MQTIQKNLDQILILLLILGIFFTTPKVLLFYDAPEYVDLAKDNGLFKAMTMGHMPIHPLFMAFLWIVTRAMVFIRDVSWAYAGNLSAAVFGIASIISFYKLTELFLRNDLQRLLSLVMFSVFPLVWIVNSNLMVESMMLPFFISSVYFLKKYLDNSDDRSLVYYMLSVFVLIGSHIQTLFWIPAITGINLVLDQKYDLNKVREIIFYTVLAIISGIFLYLVLYIYAGRELLSSLLDLLVGHSGTLSYQEPIGYLRMIRNILLSISRGFGVLSLILIIYLLVMDAIKKKALAGWIFFSIAVVVEGAIWSGDYMQRRLVFSGVLLALLFVRRFSAKSIFILFYLIFIIVPNILLYSEDKRSMPLYQLSHLVEIIPGDQVYVQTHYVSPFVKKYDGEIVWVDSVSVEMINDLLRQKRVFIDSQGIRAPYYVYSGNNYHITSLAKVGSSPAQKLFEAFKSCFYTNYGEIAVYELKRSGTKCTSEQVFASGLDPGDPVIFYSSNPLKRVSRRRVDYGDIFTWIWYIGREKKDALDWIYADVNGDVINVGFSDSDLFRSELYISGEIE